MTFGQIRVIRWGLFFLMLASVSYVGSFFWRGFGTPNASRRGDIDEPASPTSREVELEQLDSEGRTAWSLTAAESFGQTEAGQIFKDVAIRFNAGDETPVVVTADHCEIKSNRAVHLEGNVVVVDDTSLRLEANTLEFRRFPDRVWSTEPVRYSKTGFSGTSGSMAYTINRGELYLNDGVAMTYSEDGDAPVDVQSRSATLMRNRHWVQYIDDVRVVQANRRLNANDLQIHLDDTDQFVTRVEAFEAVDLRLRVASAPRSATDETEDEDVGSSVDASAALTSEPGSKRLLTERLEMDFQEGGETLSRVRALDGGKLIMLLPEEATDGLDKTLEGNLLAFEFDENGELIEVRGRGGVELVLTPRNSGEETKIVRSRQLESEFDPRSGDMIRAECSRSVSFEQGAVRATADLGVFEAKASRLILTESPRLWDPTANLLADRIELDMESGDVTGEGRVRASGRIASEGVGVFPGSGSEEKRPVHFVSDHMAYSRASDVAKYRGAARAFQGENRIEAESIEIHQKTGDLIADGSVRSVFLQMANPDDPAKPVPTHTRAEGMVYRAKEQIFEYRVDARMQSSKMTLSGASIDVKLSAEGGGVQEIVASGEVAIETAEGKASGDDARYLPKDESMTITGEEAWLENAGKVTEGKQLTFFLTDDRILVDGQEQNRTKTTYSSKPRTR